MREMTFFYVTNRPTPFADLDKDFDPMLDKLRMALLCFLAWYVLAILM